MQSISITQLEIAKVYHLGSGSRSAKAMTGDEASSYGLCLSTTAPTLLKGTRWDVPVKTKQYKNTVLSGRESEMLNIFFVYCVGTACEVSVGPAPAEKPRASNDSTAGCSWARERSHYSEM